MGALGGELESQDGTAGPETKYRRLLEISRKISRTLDLQERLAQILERAGTVKR